MKRAAGALAHTPSPSETFDLDGLGEVRCDRCGARRFVGALDGLAHATCPRVTLGTWRVVLTRANA